jgi:hypothetical protein
VRSPMALPSSGLMCRQEQGQDHVLLSSYRWFCLRGGTTEQIFASRISRSTTPRSFINESVPLRVAPGCTPFRVAIL